MLAPSSDLLRVGLRLKLNQVEQATRSYLRDRTDQATGIATSYAVAAGLFAVAGIFLVAACLVGVIALYRWVAINYGEFWGFGAVGALLVAIAAICAGLAAMKLRRQPPRFPSLASRLRVAVATNPLRSGQIDPDKGHRPKRFGGAICTRNLRPTNPKRTFSGSSARPQCANRPGGRWILLGLAVARRRQQARRVAM